MKTNTSIHGLNADGGIGPIKRRLWLLLNTVNNGLFPNAKGGLRVKRFAPHLDKASWEGIDPKSSPSRALSDLFWKKLDWSAIVSEAGRLHVFDAGCGNGEYALRLQEFSGGSIERYYGIDSNPRESWAELQKNHDYIALKPHDSGDIVSIIPEDTNLFVTQSAIEHFENDLLFFEQIHSFIRRFSGPIIQIHLFPSAACLKLYLYHGVRQYTPRTVSAITRLFDPETTCTILYELGGKACNRLHYDYITKPLLIDRNEDWRETKTDTYGRLLMETVESDIADPGGQPSFYALVIHSGYRKKIFESMGDLSERHP